MAVAAIAGLTGASGGTPNSVTWANIFGKGYGSNAPQTLAGIGAGTATLTATITGTSNLLYIKNGTSLNYSGAFTVANGDKLGWALISNGADSGTITVKCGSTTIGTFTYVISNLGGGGWF